MIPTWWRNWLNPTNRPRSRRAVRGRRARRRPLRLEALEDRCLLAATLVADINPGAPGSAPFYLVNLDGTLYFAANDGTHGAQLWTSDGTVNGTTPHH
jgi:hypothetical protein